MSVLKDKSYVVNEEQEKVSNLKSLVQIKQYWDYMIQKYSKLHFKLVYNIMDRAVSNLIN